MSNKNPEVAVENIFGQFIYLFQAFKFRILALPSHGIGLKSTLQFGR
jgi:hypothetical protein